VIGHLGWWGGVAGGGLHEDGAGVEMAGEQVPRVGQSLLGGVALPGRDHLTVGEPLGDLGLESVGMVGEPGSAGFPCLRRLHRPERIENGWRAPNCRRTI